MDEIRPEFRLLFKAQRGHGINLGEQKHIETLPPEIGFGHARASLFPLGSNIHQLHQRLRFGITEWFEQDRLTRPKGNGLPLVLRLVRVEISESAAL